MRAVTAHVTSLDDRLRGVALPVPEQALFAHRFVLVTPVPDPVARVSRRDAVNRHVRYAIDSGG